MKSAMFQSLLCYELLQSLGLLQNFQKALYVVAYGFNIASLHEQHATLEETTFDSMQI